MSQLQQANVQDVTHDTTESPLGMPGLGQTFRLLGRAFRNRCPNCGVGSVLERQRIRTWGNVRARCVNCNFRFMRSSDQYFAGAIFTNLFLSESLFAIAFTATVIGFWPDVPWDALTYVAVVGAVLAPTLMYPFAKVLWLTVDVLVRPITENELRVETA